MATANPSYYQTGPVGSTKAPAPAPAPAVKAKTNPTYYSSASPSAIPQMMQQQEHHFHLYMTQVVEGVTGSNQLTVVNPNRANYFGRVVAMDWVIRDDLGPKAKVIASAQGLHMGSGIGQTAWFTTFTIAFTDQRFKGSSLMVQGIIGNVDTVLEGEWAIVGGTGEFAYAQGVVAYKQLSYKNGIDIREINMHALCPILPKPTPVTKNVPPHGGNGGTPYDIPQGDLPQRLESVTIQGGDVIDSIAFTYIGQDGARRSVGPFGGDGGIAHPPIMLGPSEAVKEIFGTIGNFEGDTVVTSLTIITSTNNIHGPYGKQSSGNKSFRIAKDNHIIVGFYGRAGGFVDQIGAYMRPN